MTHPLTIGQVAEHTGVAAQTFWYYEGVGVPPAATAAGYRPRNSCLNTSLIEVRDRGHASQVTDFAASNGARDGVGPKVSLVGRAAYMAAAVTGRSLAQVRGNAVEPEGLAMLFLIVRGTLR